MLETMQLDIVSAEGSIYSGEVEKVTVTGSQGILGIYPGHMPLLTPLKPGYVYTIFKGGKEDYFFISGGFLEVQPEVVTVLADTAARAEDLDQEAATSAKKRAEQILKGEKRPLNTQQAMHELQEAIAQLRVIQMLQRKGKSR